MKAARVKEQPQLYFVQNTNALLPLMYFAVGCVSEVLKPLLVSTVEHVFIEKA